MLKKYFKNSPDGLPGNDDTGVMSAWAIYAMAGLYPIVPGEPIYTLTAPKFEKITFHLNEKYYPNKTLTLESNASAENNYIQKIWIDEKPYHSFFITHEQLKNAKKIKFELGKTPKKK